MTATEDVQSCECLSWMLRHCLAADMQLPSDLMKNALILESLIDTLALSITATWYPLAVSSGTTDRSCVLALGERL